MIGKRVMTWKNRAKMRPIVVGIMVGEGREASRPYVRHQENEQGAASETGAFLKPRRGEDTSASPVSLRLLG
jgi:hypothetical protein